MPLLTLSDPPNPGPNPWGYQCCHEDKRPQVTALKRAGIKQTLPGLVLRVAHCGLESKGKHEPKHADQPERTEHKPAQPGCCECSCGHYDGTQHDAADKASQHRSERMGKNHVPEHAVQNREQENGDPDENRPEQRLSWHSYDSDAQRWTWQA